MVAYGIELVVNTVDVIDDGKTRGLRLCEEGIASKVIRADPHAVDSLCVGNVQDRGAVGGVCLVSKKGRNLVAFNIREWTVDRRKIPVHLLVRADRSRNGIVVKVGSGVVCNVARPNTSAGGSRIALIKK